MDDFPPILTSRPSAKRAHAVLSCAPSGVESRYLDAGRLELGEGLDTGLADTQLCEASEVIDSVDANRS
jgi:hypothetical protein